MSSSKGHNKDFYEAKYARSEELARTSKDIALSLFGELGQGLAVLDLGCGTGMNSEWIAARGDSVVGIDVSENAIQRYRARGFTGHVADANGDLPFERDSFDAVFCSEVIEHLVDPDFLTAEMFRVLRPGGRLILTTPNSAFWLYRLLGLAGYTVSELQHPKHIQFFSRRSLLKVLVAAGYIVERQTARNMYLILPDLNLPGLRCLYSLLGFRKEVRFRTGKVFWHLSRASGAMNSFFGDTLICLARKPG